MTDPITKPKPSVYLERAAVRLRAQAVEAALEACEEGLRHWRWNERLWTRKVQILQRLGRLDTAQAIVEDETGFAKKAQGSAYFQLRAVELYLEQGALDQAQARLDRIEDMGPKQEIVWLMGQGKIGLASGRHGVALSRIEPRLTDFPTHAALHALVARNMVGCGRVEDAIGLLQAAFAQGNMGELRRDLVRLLLDEGREAEAARYLEDVTDGAPVWMVLEAARLTQQRGDLDGAIALIEAGLRDAPRDNSLHIALWRLQLQAGRGAEAVQASARYAGRNRGAVRVGLAALRLHYAADCAEAGETLLAQLLHDHPDNPLVRLGAVSVLLDFAYDPQAALDLLDGGGAALEGQTRAIRLRAKALRQLGFVPEAVALLRQLEARDALDHEGRLQLARFLIMLGRFEELDGVLAPVQRAGRTLRAEYHAMRAEAHFQTGDLLRARAQILRAIAIRQRDGSYLNTLAKFQMHGGAHGAAWENIEAMTRRAQARQPMGRASGKTLRSLLGQMLNEYRLFFGADDGFGPRWSSESQPAALAHFRAVLARDPGSTPAAMAVLSALHRTGQTRMAPPDCGGETRIPKVVHQFWDKPDLPPQVAALMDWNRQLNPDYRFERYDLRAAIAYCEDRGATDVARAMLLHHLPAAQADLFRLVVLWHEGGVFLDADDRIVQPLSELLDHRLRFTGYLETFWTVGNNFMAVQPGDPIIRAAMEEALEAATGPTGTSIWLASGPGAISRALARLGTDGQGQLAPDIWIMPLHRMHHALIPHVRMSYKTSGVHWVRQLQRGPG